MGESEKFDAIVRRVFSVSHDEIVKREKEYKKRRKLAKQKRAAALSRKPKPSTEKQ